MAWNARTKLKAYETDLCNLSRHSSASPHTNTLNYFILRMHYPNSAFVLNYSPDDPTVIPVWERERPHHLMKKGLQQCTAASRTIHPLYNL